MHSPVEHLAILAFRIVDGSQLLKFDCVSGRKSFLDMQWLNIFCDVLAATDEIMRVVSILVPTELPEG